jgi:hypothetical protein
MDRTIVKPAMATTSLRSDRRHSGSNCRSPDPRYRSDDSPGRRVKFKVRRVTAILAPSFEGFARSRHHKYQDDHEHERPYNE